MENSAQSKSQRQKCLNQFRKKAAKLEEERASPTETDSMDDRSLLSSPPESTANGILVVDSSDKVISYNIDFLRMWGVPETLAGQGDMHALLDFMMDQLQEPDAFMKTVRHVHDHPGEESFDVVLLEDGRVFDRYSQPQRIGHEIVGRVWSFQDATMRVLTEHALEQRRSEFEAIFSSIADAAVFVNMKRQIEAVNPAFTRMFGYAPGQLRGKTLRILFAADADYAEAENRHLRLYAADDRTAFACSYRRRDGTTFAGETVGSRVIDEHRGFMGFLLIFRDITERKQIEEALGDSEERFRMLLNSTAEAIYGTDTSGRCIFCNETFLRQTGYAREADLLGKDMHELIHGKHADGTAYPADECRLSEDALHGEGVHVDEEVLWRSDGSYFYAECWAYPIEKRGKVVGTVVTFLDISERKRVQDTLKAGEAKYRHLFSAMLNGFAYHKIIVDENGAPVDYVFLEVNDAFERLTGLSRKDVIGRRVTDVIPGIAASGFDWIGTYGKVALTGVGINFEQFSPELNRWYSVSAYSPEKGYFSAVFEDITERRKMEDDIRHLAYHDSLTGLSKRAVLMDHIEVAITQAHRSKQMLAVLFLDLDRFKHINDAYGHETGDQLLMEVGLRLRSCVRETDTVARIGGDEFSILLAEIKHAEDAARIAEKVISCMQKPFVINNHELHMSASIGISTYPADSIRPEMLLKCADVAMYHAKESGRGSYQFYNQFMKARTIERMIFENSLRKALDRGELLVYYQPLVDMQTHKIVCCEALVRWQHPEMGLLDPVKFIPLAEDTGLIKFIGEFVLRTACAQSRAWQKAGQPRFCTTVNLSAHEFQNPGIVELITRVLFETGHDPALLELEITESTAMRDASYTIDKLQKLSDMGIRFSLDDFGTGYSSLSYLKKLPIKKLKIDKSFVSGLRDDKDAQAIVYAVIAMAHSLNLSVVAEGVETDEQLNFLDSCHCDQVQGYLYSRPLPVHDFQKFTMTH
ncbi:MAG: EAL domain-containing protein [Nitrospirae bacterium]|nr:EAL domain-containing protein [Nitrospirota bacterium]